MIQYNEQGIWYRSKQVAPRLKKVCWVKIHRLRTVYRQVLRYGQLEVRNMTNNSEAHVGSRASLKASCILLLSKP